MEIYANIACNSTQAAITKQSEKYYNIYTQFSAFPCYTFSEIILFYCTKKFKSDP